MRARNFGGTTANTERLLRAVDLIRACALEEARSAELLCLLNECLYGAAPVESVKLTRSEREVLAGLLEGMPAKLIAQSRRSSFHTVRSQIKSILAKTGLHSQRELIIAFGRGVLPDTKGLMMVTAATATSEFQFSRAGLPRPAHT